MLANLLPGFRHVRTPLATGYLYLLTLWLLFGDRLIPSTHDAGFPGSVADLASLVGPTPTFAAVSFGAYLIGSLVTIPQWPSGIAMLEDDEHPRTRDWSYGLNAWVEPIAARLNSRVTFGDVDGDPGLPSDLRHWLRVQWQLDREDLASRAAEWRVAQEKGETYVHLWEPEEDLHEVPEGLGKHHPDGYFEHLNPSSLWWGFDRNATNDPVQDGALQSSLLNIADHEVQHVTGRLRAENETLFNEYDRLRTEAELRYSIAPPLAASAILLAVTWTPWALVALLGVGLLVRKAYASERAATVVVIDALQYGIVQSPTVQALERLSERRARRRWPPAPASPKESPEPPG